LVVKDKIECISEPAVKASEGVGKMDSNCRGSD